MRAATLLVPLLAGCSLVLDEVPIPECTNDADCAVLGTLAGLPATCRKHYCSGNGRCEEHPDGAEVCDGWDNDCDGKIDEPGLGEQTLVGSGSAVVEGLANLAHLSYGFADGSANVAWSTQSRTGFAAPLPEGGARAVTLATNATNTLRDPDPLDGSCHRRTAGGVVQAPCNVTEMTSAPVGERSLVAVVSTEGCAKGLLFTGYSDAESARVMVRGPLRRSNSFIGVDPTSTGACTGASRPACGSDGSGDQCGAARPALATIDHGAPSCPAGVELCPDRVGQGLLAFLGDGVSRGRCGGTEANVEVLGLHLMIAPLEGALLWVTSSDEGVPEVLGTTTGGGHPAVVAWEGRGYFVAYGTAGGVALHFVPAFAEPPSYDGVSGDPDDRTGQETGPLAGIVDLGTISGGVADHVALSIGATRGDALDLGVAWIEGCGGDERIVFRQVVVATSGGEPTSVAERGDGARLAQASGNTILAAPSLAYRESGFVVEGFERGGATADDTLDGGFVVAWAEGTDTDRDGRPDTAGRMVASRVAELDGAPVDDDERIDLTQGGAANAWEPALWGDSFAYWDRAAGTIVSGAVACLP